MSLSLTSHVCLSLLPLMSVSPLYPESLSFPTYLRCLSFPTYLWCLSFPTYLECLSFPAYSVCLLPLTCSLSPLTCSVCLSPLTYSVYLPTYSVCLSHLPIVSVSPCSCTTRCSSWSALSVNSALSRITRVYFSCEQQCNPML